MLIHLNETQVVNIWYYSTEGYGYSITCKIIHTFAIQAASNYHRIRHIVLTVCVTELEFIDSDLGMSCLVDSY